MTEILLGVAGPLAAVSVSWALMERTYRRDPRKLTPLMMVAFFAKMVFFGGYVALMVEVVRVRPAPFIASFTAAFITLYVIEAALMRRMFNHAG